MKKLFAILFCALFLTSCYTSKVAHGSIAPEQGTVQLASVKEHYLIAGLVPLSGGTKASKYVGNRTDYVTVRQQTFVDGFLSWVTGQLYTPMTVKFYGKE